MSAQSRPARVPDGLVECSVEHPSWCDPGLCTATADAVVGKAHRSAPTIVGAEGAGRVRVTMSLSRAHAPWPTIPYVRFHLSGLDVDFRTVSGEAALTAVQAADLGRGLVHLARLAMESER
jgi:hypothetical protein